MDLRDHKGKWKNQQAIKEVKRFDDFVTIDWVEDELINHKNAQKETIHTSLKIKLFSFIRNWLVLSLMGIIIGLIAGSLNVITAWLASVRFGYCSQGFYLNESFCCYQQGHCDSWHTWWPYETLNYFQYILISMFLAYLTTTIVLRYSPLAAGSGISEIKCIVSGFSMRGFLGWSTLLIKSITLPLAIGSGLSIGKEGPSVHYAVGVGNSVGKLFEKYRKSASKAREFLTATSAAGVAVAFGSPMGGVLFSMEEISNVFQLSTIFKSYFCSLVAVSTLAAINPFRSGQLVMFEVVYDTDWYYFEIPLYIVLGLFGGFYGIVISKFNIIWVSFRKQYLTNFAVREVLLLALFTSSISYFNQFLKIDMTESMQILFNECNGINDLKICHANKGSLMVSLFMATVIRMLLIIITYGCKIPAGIFVPSMAVGATFGRLIGILMEIFYERNPDLFIFKNCTTDKCIIPGAYAFLGSAATLSGITHLTVTVIVIMFELTGAIRYIIPTMIVVGVTKFIGDKWGKGGIADQMITFNGLPLIDPKEDISYNLNSVEKAMSNVLITLPVVSDTPLTVGKLKSIVDKNDFRGYPLIESEFTPKISGFINASDIRFFFKNKDLPDDMVVNLSKVHNDDQLNLGDLINPCPLTISSTTTLEYVAEIFVKLGPRYMLVEADGSLVGLITRKDILRYEHSVHHKPQEPQFERKLWDLWVSFSVDIKRKLGQLISNDPTRFL